MKQLEIGQSSHIFKSLVFAVLMAVSWTSLGQDINTDSVDRAGVESIEVEQININHADASTIARVLNGVGMSRAQAIVTFRDEYGEFTSLEDLMLVKGVGEVTLRNNQARINFE